MITNPERRVDFPTIPRSVVFTLTFIKRSIQKTAKAPSKPSLASPKKPTHFSHAISSRSRPEERPFPPPSSFFHFFHLARPDRPHGEVSTARRPPCGWATLTASARHSTRRKLAFPIDSTSTSRPPAPGLVALPPPIATQTRLVAPRLRPSLASTYPVACLPFVAFLSTPPSLCAKHKASHDKSSTFGTTS